LSGSNKNLGLGLRLSRMVGGRRTVSRVNEKNTSVELVFQMDVKIVEFSSAPIIICRKWSWFQCWNKWSYLSEDEFVSIGTFCD